MFRIGKREFPYDAIEKKQRKYASMIWYFDTTDHDEKPAAAVPFC